MIEIKNVEEGRPGGSVQYSFDAVIKPYGELELCGLKLHGKGAQSWINLPQQSYETKSGEKKYLKILGWPDKTEKKIKAEIKTALEEYLKVNPDFASKSVLEGIQDPFSEVPF